MSTSNLKTSGLSSARFKEAGFTLIEVLVAMVIIAVTLTAASRAAGKAIDSSAELRRRVAADIVAQNRLELHKARRDWLTPGKFTGEETQAGILMDWSEVVTDSPNPAFRKIVVEVYAPEDSHFIIRRLVGFLTLEPKQ